VSDANKPTVYGMEVGPLPANATPLEAVAVVKVLEADGEISLAVRVTTALTPWEVAGLLRSAQILNDARILDGCTPSGDDDET